VCCSVCCSVFFRCVAVRSELKLQPMFEDYEVQSCKVLQCVSQCVLQCVLAVCCSQIRFKAAPDDRRV